MIQCTTTLPNMDIYAIRLLPGEDLRMALQKCADENRINAGWIFSCVGSLTKYAIRFANEPLPALREGHYEIVHLTGTVSDKGCHLHIIVSDKQGMTIGGHVAEGCFIYTTAEIIIGCTSKYMFDRKPDVTTGWKELTIEQKNTQ
jgi:predicted DNA-binding protein with PD1-like motif